MVPVYDVIINFCHKLLVPCFTVVVITRYMGCKYLANLEMMKCVLHITSTHTCLS